MQRPVVEGREGPHGPTYPASSGDLALQATGRVCDRRQRSTQAR